MHEDDDYTPSRSKSGAALPRVPTSPDFRFGTHPAKWEADIDAGRILPVLVRIDIEAGTHHVGRDGDAVGMERAFRSKGWDILEPDVIGQMPGSEHEYYIKRIRVAGGGLAHLPVWTQALGGSSRILPDEDLHRAFRLYLVDEGLVSLPRPDQMKDAIKRAESSQASNAREADRDPPREAVGRVLGQGDRGLEQGPSPRLRLPRHRPRPRRGRGSPPPRRWGSFRRSRRLSDLRRPAHCSPPSPGLPRPG